MLCANVPVRSSAWSLIVVLLSLFTARAAQGHSGEVPPPPRPPPAPRAPDAAIDRRVQEVLPPRWSWLYWWEANRDRFLRAPSQDQEEQAADPARWQALRDEAAGELARAVQSGGSNALMARSAVALGKMRVGASLDLLKTVAADANNAEARLSGLAGIGLLGSPEAEAALVGFKPGRTDANVAALVALGLCRDISPETLRLLRAATANEHPGIATAVCFSLRQHHQKLDLAYYGNLLIENESPWVASEALIAVGMTRDPQARDVLENVLHGTRRARTQVAAWELLESMHVSKVEFASQPQRTGRDRASYERQYADYRKKVDAFNKKFPNRKQEAKGKVAAVDGGTEIIGMELIQLAQLRGSAAIGLGELQDPAAAAALLRFLAPTPAEDEYLIAPKQFAIMALTSYPSGESRDRFIALLGKQDEKGKMVLDGPRDGALRAFAALALGLYARPYDTPQGAADRVGYDWAILTLAERLEDEKEHEEIRTACAIGLGLAQRTAVLPVLHRTCERILERNRKQDMLLFGYALLGRAMAGDRNVIEPAATFLGTTDDTSSSGILARRAAVLSLGVARSSSAIPALTKAWHLNHYVNREVIVALRLVGGANVATPLMQRLRESKNAEERAYMAEALGELLAPEQPTPLARLVAQANYTVRNDNLLPLQRMANGFLYDFLIASFGEEW